jgi:Leucine-rich repeat (LRR) protein
MASENSKDKIQQTETIHGSDDEDQLNWSSDQRLKMEPKMIWNGTRCRVINYNGGSIRELIGPHTEVTSVEIYLCYCEYEGVKSMEDCDDLQNLVVLSICPDYSDDVCPNVPLICLNGIEFCSSLKVLIIPSLEITNLTPLAHLELEELNVSGNPISDLSMIKTEILTIDEKQVPLVLSAFGKPSFKVKTIIVKCNYLVGNVTNDIEIFDNHPGIEIFDDYAYNVSDDIIKYFNSKPELLKSLYAIQNILSSIIPIDMLEQTKYSLCNGNVTIGKILIKMSEDVSFTLCEYEKMQRGNHMHGY